MKILDRYLTRVATLAVFLTLLSLVSITSLFALFEELGESQATYGFIDALTYLAQTLPRRVDELLSYCVFLGYLLSLGSLAENGELTAARVAGVSPMRLLGALIPSLIICLLVSFCLSEYLAPTGEQAAERGKQRAQYGENALSQKGGLWFRDGGEYVQISTLASNGDLQGIRRYSVDEQHQLIQSLQAESATFDESVQTWTLYNGSITQLNNVSTQAQAFAQQTWQTPMTPKLLASQAFLEPKKMPLIGIHNQITFLEQQNLSATEYELVYWSRILKPLTFFGMALLALAIVIGPLRSSGMGQRLTIGIFVGLGFKYLQDLFAPTAIVFGVPAIIAVALPTIIFALAARTLIKRFA
jgi:lipopolysaccharide export system permease protein